MTYLSETNKEYRILVFNSDGTLIDQKTFSDETEARIYRLQEAMKGYDTQIVHRNLLVE
jgi:hypothetical protein